MEAIIKTEYAKQGDKEYIIYSKNHERAIYGDDGARLDRKLKGLRADINDLGGGGIVDTQTGITITSKNSADSYIELHDIYGQSSQEGTPTPESPAEIKSVGGYIYTSAEGELSGERISCAELPVLHSIGEIKDKLYRDSDGLWKIERNIQSNVLTGEEEIKLNYIQGDFTNYEIYTQLAEQGAEAISDTMEYSREWTFENNHFYLENGFLVVISNIKTIEELRQSLRNNKMHYQYIKKNKETEILPVAQQMGLNSLKSFEGKTIVYTVSQVQPNLTVDFYSKSVGYGIDRSNAIHNAIDLSINRRMVSNTAVTEPGFLPDALLVTENAGGIAKNKENISRAHNYINASFPFDSAGWIRIARNKNGYAAVRGGSADSCTITIKRGYSYDNNEMMQINLDKVYQKTRLTLVRKFYNRQIIVKVRHVFSAEEAYIEVLYTSNSGNGAYIEIDNPLAGNGGWEAIAPEATQETVPGYTVDAELDLTIPGESVIITNTDKATFDVNGVSSKVFFNGGFIFGTADITILKSVAPGVCTNIFGMGHMPYNQEIVPAMIYRKENTIHTCAIFNSDGKISPIIPSGYVWQSGDRIYFNFNIAVKY